jgi:hypothetical protein
MDERAVVNLTTGSGSYLDFFASWQSSYNFITIVYTLTCCYSQCFCSFVYDVVSISDYAVSIFRLISEKLVCQNAKKTGKLLLNGSVNCCPYMALIVGGRDNNERRYRNNADKGKTKHSERTFPSATFSSRNATLAVLE